MYEQFYQLRAEPFRLSPDHRFCFNHRSYAKAKAYMQYALHRAEGFVMITGRPGTGKTTLVNDLLDGLSRSKVTVAMLVTTQLEANDLLRMVAYAFGLDADAPHKATILQNLTMMLTRHHRERKRALLIIDEAQDLSSSALEELRLLTNLQLNNQPLLQIFLLGQEALRDLVQEPGMEQVHQRLVAACHLEPLKEEETRDYIKHRLERVGWQGDPAISEAIFPLIYKFSHGVPRRINLVCSRLFLHGSVEERHQIGIEDARTVIEELQQEQLMPLSLQEDPEFSMPAFEELRDDTFAPAPAAAEPTTAQVATSESAEKASHDANEGPLIAPQQETASAETSTHKPAESTIEAESPATIHDPAIGLTSTPDRAEPQAYMSTVPPAAGANPAEDPEQAEAAAIAAAYPLNVPRPEETAVPGDRDTPQGEPASQNNSHLGMTMLAIVLAAALVAALYMLKPAALVALLSDTSPNDATSQRSEQATKIPPRAHIASEASHTGLIIRQPAQNAAADTPDEHPAEAAAGPLRHNIAELYEAPATAAGITTPAADGMAQTLSDDRHPFSGERLAMEPAVDVEAEKKN